jgi:hypothetical protein
MSLTLEWAPPAPEGQGEALLHPGLDRETIRLKRDRRLLSEYHRQVLELKRPILDRRGALGEAWLMRHKDRDPGAVISRETGIGQADLGGLELTRSAIGEAKAFIEGRPEPRRAKGSVGFFALGDDFGETSAAVQLAWSPEFLSPVIRYFVT